jgi:sulfate permease, SulP family
LNFQAGAKTPLAAMCAGLFLIVIVVMVAPLAAYLPNAAMAGILFLVAWGLIDFHEIGHVLRSSRRETGIMAVTFFGALFLELEFAIFAGVILSLVLYLMRVSRPRIISRVPDARLPGRKFNTDPTLPMCPQLHILRVDGSLFFGSINHVQEAFADLEEQHPDQKHLAIVAEGINFADITGGAILVDEARKRKARGGGFYLMKVKKGLWESLESCECLDAIGPNNVFQSKTAGITAIFQKLDKNICRHCDKRIFRECASIPRETDL